MKRLKEITGFYEVFPDLPEQIKTDKDFIDYLKSQGIKRVDVDEDGIHHYGWANKNTKTSLYIISEYYSDDSLLWSPDSLEDLRDWIKNGFPDHSLNEKYWQKVCK